MSTQLPGLLTICDVVNQPPPLEDVNLFALNLPLQEALARDDGAWAHEELVARGAELGSAEWIERGTLANRNPPTLKLFDRYGRRRDEVEFHPAWHECLAYLKRHGLDTAPWAEPRPGAHVARAAHFMLFAEIEDGSLCPTTMTYGCVPAVRRDPVLAREWLPLILSRHYDRRFMPAAQKTGAMLGMGMTEKQGGSDVRTNTTRAEPVGGGEYRIVGHKWFLSAPMCDAFLVLAQAPGGLSCFFMPRWRPDGRLNDIRIQRLKDKLGDRSNAGTEVEFWGAYARLLGEEGRGVPTILEMGTYTRLDCALGSTGLMRQSLTQALHHAHHRNAFGKLLVEHPLMRNVLADLALECEAATVLAMRLARAFDRADDEYEGLIKRILTPATKYWICKRGPVLAAEAMEVLGGNGYVEDGVMARIYRQMPLNSIWEGSGNVMCLDVLRAIGKTPQVLEALMTELEQARGLSPVLDGFVAWFTDQLRRPEHAATRARILTQSLALAVQASLLIRFAPHYVATAFCASRLDQDWGHAFGTLPPGTDLGSIIARAWPIS
jgi:putative acyl-CoA dehydrogenase